MVNENAIRKAVEALNVSAFGYVPGFGYRRQYKQIGPFLFEYHERICQCSYCNPHIYSVDREPRKTFSLGLELPHSKAWNSWRILYFVGIKTNYYLRWTGFWLRKPQPN